MDRSCRYCYMCLFANHKDCKGHYCINYEEVYDYDYAGREEEAVAEAISNQILDDKVDICKYRFTCEMGPCVEFCEWDYCDFFEQVKDYNYYGVEDDERAKQIIAEEMARDRAYEE